MIEITEKGFLTLPVCSERHALAGFGVPRGGPMDPVRCLLANRLAGNPDTAGALEATLGLPGIRFTDERAFAVVGGAEEMTLLRGGEKLAVKPGETLTALPGDELLPCPLARGMRAYIAVSGGIRTELRPRSVKKGDMLSLGEGGKAPLRRIVREVLPLPGDEAVLRVIPGVQRDHFSAEGAESFYSEEYTYTPLSDRMGIRLSGAAVGFADGHDGNIISEGMLPGDIQITSAGQPILMTADCPTAGGYAKIAHLISADMPLAAQLRPGARLRFRQVEVADAHIALRRLMLALGGCIR